MARMRTLYHKVNCEDNLDAMDKQPTREELKRRNEEAA